MILYVYIFHYMSMSFICPIYIQYYALYQYFNVISIFRGLSIAATHKMQSNIFFLQSPWCHFIQVRDGWYYVVIVNSQHRRRHQSHSAEAEGAGNNLAWEPHRGWVIASLDTWLLDQNHRSELPPSSLIIPHIQHISM